jgi:hypothetical protein
MIYNANFVHEFEEIKPVTMATDSHILGARLKAMDVREITPLCSRGSQDEGKSTTARARQWRYALLKDILSLPEIRTAVRQQEDMSSEWHGHAALNREQLADEVMRCPNRKDIADPSPTYKSYSHQWDY